MITFLETLIYLLSPLDLDAIVVLVKNPTKLLNTILIRVCEIVKDLSF